MGRFLNKVRSVNGAPARGEGKLGCTHASLMTTLFVSARDVGEFVPGEAGAAVAGFESGGNVTFRLEDGFPCAQAAAELAFARPHLGGEWKVFSLLRAPAKASLGALEFR